MPEIIKPKQRPAEVLQQAMEAFVNKHAHKLLTDKRVNQDVAGVIVSSLAGVCALGVRAGFGSVEDFTDAILDAFARQFARDIAGLK